MAEPPAVTILPVDPPKLQTPGTLEKTPWYFYAAILGVTSIIVGLIWDISWHRTIGRDTFWTPAHMAIYLGGVLCGSAGGWLALKATYFGSAADKASGVKLGPFYAPLGAWISIWGALAMLTSAPFDDWWHNAYGLDVEIISPPHMVLAAGILALCAGSLLLILALQNRASGKLRKRYSYGLAYIGGMVIALIGILFMADAFAQDQHSMSFYITMAAALPIFLVATGRAVELKWPATTAAFAYMLVNAIMIWVLQLFPAEPLLAPILNQVDHMTPPPFPMLLVLPALAIDLVMNRVGTGKDWRLTLYTGVAFFAVFFVVQWFFSMFLVSPAAENWFFAGQQFGYNETPGNPHGFWAPNNGAFSTALIPWLAFALGLSLVSARIGLWWGNWMVKVQR